VRLPLALATLFLGHHLLAVQLSLVVQPARCQLDNGRIFATAIGGIPPYVFSWSNGATTSSIQQLAPGDYTVTVTDGLGNTAEATGAIGMVNTFQVTTMDQGCGGFGSVWVMPVDWQVDGPFTWTIEPDNGWPAEFEPGMGYRFTGLSNFNSYLVSGISANGCETSIEFSPWFQDYTYHQVSSISPACGGEANGSFLLDLQPGFPYSMELTGPGGTTTVDCGEGPCSVSGLPAGEYYANLIDQWTGMYFYCAGVADFTIPALDPPCGGLSGVVYHDAGEDCTLGTGDVPLVGRVLTIGPDEQYAITGPGGQYLRNLELGAYTIGLTMNDMGQVCPGSDPQPFTLTGLQPAAVVDFALVSTVPHDVRITLTSVAARPGFPTTVRAKVRNLSFFPSGALGLSLAFDPLLLNPQPANGLWSHPGLGAFEEATFIFTATVPPDVGLLGQVLTYSASVNNAEPEQDLDNNTAVLDITITGSYDPNDKQGWANASGSDTQFLLNEDAWIDYLVRFQNTGTDTAFTVVVRDDIDARLDILSLDILDASHAFVPSFDEGRELVFTFNDILLPDSTTDLQGSQGFVSFRLKPVPGLLPGDAIPNTAAIYFDFNDPIITNTTEHVVETSTAVPDSTWAPHIRLVPNPATDVLQVWMPGMIDRELVMLTVDGRIVQPKGTANAQGVLLDVRTLPPGVYMVRTLTGTARFMKQ